MNLKVLFDPLYGAVPFKMHKFGVDYFFYDVSTREDEEIEKLEKIDDYAQTFAAILKTFEFCRLNFLKQAGFSWLVYPSATHTRYAHSLGCWYLAEQALACVKIRERGTPKGHEKFLERWLEGQGLIEEFLLSLLLHDIGHFPFSHVLENNPRYYDIPHEKVGAQLIRGEGEFFEIYKKITTSGSKSIKHARRVDFLSVALSKLKKVVKLDTDVISALITKDLSYLHKKKQEVKNAVPVMMELVSGLIDLDRIDHYHRDSHFMGLKVTSVSPIALLANMVIIPEPSSDPPSARIELEDDGIMQMFSLLESKETLKNYVFDNEHNMAYSAMLNAALDIFLEDKPELEREVLLWTDDFLLSQLSNHNNNNVLKLVDRITNGSPYIRVGSYPIFSCEKRNVEWTSQLRERLISYLQVEHGLEVENTDVLMAFSKGFFSEKKLPPDDWFSFNELCDDKGEALLRISKHSRRVEYLKGELEKSSPFLQIFAPNFATKRLLQKEIRGEQLL